MNVTRIVRGTVYQVNVYYDKQDISMEDALIHLIVNSPALRLGEAAPVPATLAEQAII